MRGPSPIPTSAETGIGIEGGIQKVGERYLECGFVVVVRRDVRRRSARLRADAGHIRPHPMHAAGPRGRHQGRTGVGTSARYELSRAIIERVEAGAELGDVMDAISGETGVRSKGGAMGKACASYPAASASFSLGLVTDTFPLPSPPFRGPSAAGLLSAGILPRDVCYAHGVIFAFAPFLSDPRYFPAS